MNLHGDDADIDLEIQCHNLSHAIWECGPGVHEPLPSSEESEEFRLYYIDRQSNKKRWIASFITHELADDFKSAIRQFNTPERVSVTKALIKTWAAKEKK